jgi:hypothetical protein
VCCGLVCMALRLGGMPIFSARLKLFLNSREPSVLGYLRLCEAHCSASD